MKYDQGISDERSEEASGSLLSSCLAAAKLAAYRVNFCHAGSLVSPRHESFFRTSPQLLVAIVQSVQLLGIVLDYAADVHGYSDLDYYLWSFNLFRPEILASQYSDPLVAFYLFLVLVFTCALLSVLEFGTALLRPEDTLPSLLRLASIAVFGLLHRILLFPCALLFLEHATAAATLWSRLLAVLGLATTCILLLSRLLFVSDNNWHIRSFHLFAKSGSDFEVKEVAVFLFISAINLGLFGSSQVLNNGLMLISTGYLYYLIVATAPYFNLITTCTKAVQYTLANWMAVCVLLGRVCQSAYVIAIVFVFVSPLLGAFSIVVVRWKLKHWKSPEDCKEFWEFEVALRRLLHRASRGKTTPAAVKDTILSAAKKFKKNKLVHLLFAQYYFYVRNEPEYALLRLACANDSTSSVLVDYQVFHFFEKVADIAKSDERRYLDYVAYYRKAMKADFALCVETCNLVNLLLSPLRSSSKLETSLSDLTKRVKFIDECYSTVIQRFPHDFTMKKQHQSLLYELFFEDTGGEVISHNRNQGIESGANMNNIGAYTAEETGVFVISCHHQKFGKIVFSNQKCAELLHTTVEEIEGRDLDDFLPPPLAIGHNKLMDNFIRAGEAKEISRSHLFLYALNSYSVEVTFRFRPSAFRGVPYFVVAIRGKKSTREFALFDNHYTITSHSKSFDKIVEVTKGEKGNLNGLSLTLMLPSIDRKYQEHGEKPFSYTHPETGTVYHVLFKSTGLGSRVLRWIYLFKEEGQIYDLIESSSRVLLERQFTLANLLLSKKTVDEEKDSGSDSSSEASSSRKRADNPRYENSGISYAPVTSFAKSAVGMKIRRSVKTAEKQYNLSFMLGALLSAVCALCNLLVLFVTMQEMSAAHTSTSTSLNLAPLHMARITYYARVLSLMSSGLEDKSLSDVVLQGLLAEATALQQIATAHVNVKYTEEVTVWSQFAGRPKCVTVGVATAISDFLTRVNAYASAGDFSDSDDFYYIYRNGIGETFDAVQHEILSRARETNNTSLLHTLTVGVVAFMLTAAALGISIIFIVKSIILLSQNHADLWKLLLNLTPEQLHSVVKPHLERMVSVHIVKELPKIRIGSRVQKNYRLSPTRRWPVLMATFFLYILTSSSIFFLAGLYSYTQLTTIIIESLDTVDREGGMVSRPIVSLFYLKETTLDASWGSGYTEIVREGQELPSTADRVLSELTTIDDEMDHLMEKMKSVSHEDTLITGLCSDFTGYPECAKSPISFGLYFALNEFMYDSMALLEELREEGSVPWCRFRSLEQQAHYLTEALVLAHSATMQAADNDISAFRRTLLVYFSLYCGGCALLYLCFYRPRVVRLKRDCMALWHAAKLIRADYITLKKT